MQCCPAPQRGGAGGGQMKCHFLNIFTRPSPHPVQWPLTSDSVSLGLAATITVNNNTAMMDNTVTSSDHSSPGIIPLSVSEICLGDYLWLPQSGDELQRGRIFAASPPRSSVSGSLRTRVIRIPGTRVLPQPWIQLPAMLRVFPRSVPNLLSEVTITHCDLMSAQVPLGLIGSLNWVGPRGFGD